MFNEQTWILNRAKLTPEKNALIDIRTERTWTYEELSKRTMNCLVYLQSLGIKKGDRVAILAENSIDLFPILFACGLGGYIYVPLNWRLSIEELQLILEDSSPSLLLTDDNFHDFAVKIHPAKTIVIKEIIEFQPTEIHSRVGTEWSPKDAWLMIYTGGTTGKPKGVVLSFDAVNWNAINTIVSWSLEENDCTLNYMPLFHTGGLNALSIPILMVGGTVVIGNKFVPEEAIRAIDDYQTTISLFVPTMYQAMIETDYFKQSHFPSVKLFLSGGAPCPKTIYEHFIEKGIKFKEGYGLTEAGPNNFYISPERSALKPGSVGRSMVFNSIKIVNKEGDLCEPNEVGELLVQGKHMFSYYWNNQEETNKAIVDGWLKTGDLAKMDDDGDVYIVGRSKDMIITGGENVYPQEVEQCIVTHPKIKEVAVVGLKDPKWGEVVTAVVVSDQGDDNLCEEIKTLCRNHLGAYKVPKKIYFIKGLPKTHVGKIDKKKIVQLYEQ
ncbi:class I adenylate-forming enzyme family protein [Ureibacillus manganicus]|uniref:Long-chain fatty acid--CoA ligase n=1 Tax=Ureibacillus manganicus DSM 26584 TaxID=1384049 RepID=A0A0A3I3W6_9BACL|nr:AMP-binding protein [Ureibacillus manganicus]KGR79496.1 long-chain fatty acid--CoA ligase [Ureibacillus manganicus DSM 26584]